MAEDNMPTVTLLIADELMEAADMPGMLDLLDAIEVGRESDARPGYTILTLAMPDVPAGATSIEPVFQTTFNGTGVEVSVKSMGWR